MSHIDENRLLAYVLEVLDSDSERAEIAAHLAGCAECRALSERVRGDVDLIGSVSPLGQVLRISNPRARGRMVFAMLRAAAMIVLGIFIGLGASSLLRRPPVEVVPQYVALSPPGDRSSGCAATDVTEVPMRYYEDLLASRPSH